MGMPFVTIHTDGAYSSSRDIGSWASYLHFEGQELFLCNAIKDTTNNRMEMQAVISALEALQEPCQVDLYSDSTYVVKGINEWLRGWKRRGWRSSTGQPVLNKDLWQTMDKLLKIHQVHAIWVKGHNGHLGNELCDQLAQAVQAYI